MILRFTYPGASYIDSTPTAFAVMYPDRFQTHQGRIELPADGNFPLFHRITEVGGFKIAGQGAVEASKKTREWIAGTWYDRPPACGVSPVIYDNQGVLHISDCSIGSQGYRYVAANGQLVTGDQSIRIAVAGTLLHEYSEYAGLLIGQGHDSGCLVWDGEKLRELEPGFCTFIRVQGESDTLAISIVKPDGAVRIIARISDLLALPAVPKPTPKPIPVPPKPPDPEPPKPTPTPTPAPPKPVPPPPPPEEPDMPKPAPPTFDQWIKHDYPQVRAAYTKTQHHAPDDEWAAFQTQRYFAYWIGLGEYWPLDRMLKEEAAPGTTSQADYPFPGG